MVPRCFSAAWRIAEAYPIYSLPAHETVLTHGRSIRNLGSCRVPKIIQEIWGIEDPRITSVPEPQQHVVTYTSYLRGGLGVSLALTKDFRS